MSEDLENKTSGIITSLIQKYKDNPFTAIITEELKTPEFKKFLMKRMQKSVEFKLSKKVGEWFDNFNLYDCTTPKKEVVKNVLIIEKNEDLLKLREKGLFTNLNSTLVLSLNFVTSFNKQNNKETLHYDEYTRLATIRLLDNIITHFAKNKCEIQYWLIGTDVVYDFSSLLPEEEMRFLMPPATSEIYNHPDFKRLDLFENIVN